MSGHGLYLAALCGHESLVRLFLKRGFDINYPCPNGRTAIMAAIEGGHDLVLRLLIDSGANVNLFQGWEHPHRYPLQLAAARNRVEIVRLLINSGAEVDAQSHGWHDNLKRYVEDLVDVKLSMHIVRFLFETGINATAPGPYYENALDIAVGGGSEHIVRLLIDCGADVNAEGGTFGYALQTAASLGNGVIIQMLLEAGANVNAQGGAFGSALIAAVASGVPSNIFMLLDNGASVMSAGQYYGKALEYAAMKPQTMGFVLRRLLEAGGDEASAWMQRV